MTRAIVALLAALTPVVAAAAPLRVAVKTRVPLTAEVAAALGAYGVVRHRLWRLDVAEMSVEAADLARLAASERVARVELDERVSAAPIESALPADLTAGVSTWGLDLIDVSDSATGARVVSETGAGVHVAVLDTGLVGAWRDFFPEERIDQEHATAFLGGANERSPWDDKGHAANPDRIWEHATYSHGTHVTGTILGFHVGAPYDLELAGVAPRAVVIPIKVLGQDGYGSNLDIVAALYYLGWLRETGAVSGPLVANLSLGTARPAAILEEAIDDAIAHGVIVVAAAGNGGPAGMSWPGAYPQVISVGAAGWKRAWLPDGNPLFLVDDVAEEGAESLESFVAFFSGRASLPGQELDVIAPGFWIFGPAVEHGAARPPRAFPYAYFMGTSMASPHVAGVAALLLEKNASLRQADVEAMLQATAIPIAAGSVTDPIIGVTSVWGTGAEEQGAGLVQAADALAL
jgi:subtilisin family serine protease